MPDIELDNFTFQAGAPDASASCTYKGAKGSACVISISAIRASSRMAMKLTIATGTSRTGANSSVNSIRRALRSVRRMTLIVSRTESASRYREALSVRETMSVILRTLRSARRMEFTELFAPVRDVPVAIVSFIAILELARIALIEITQAEPFAPLYVQLADASGAPA